MIISKALEKYSQVVLQRGCIFVLQLLKLHKYFKAFAILVGKKKYFMAASSCFFASLYIILEAKVVLWGCC